MFDAMQLCRWWCAVALYYIYTLTTRGWRWWLPDRIALMLGYSTNFRKTLFVCTLGACTCVCWWACWMHLGKSRPQRRVMIEMWLQNNVVLSNCKVVGSTLLSPLAVNGECERRWVMLGEPNKWDDYYAPFIVGIEILVLFFHCDIKKIHRSKRSHYLIK